MKLYSAWVEITGKVFVTEDELQEFLQSNYPDQWKMEDPSDPENEDKIWEFTYEQQREAFETVAQVKMHTMPLSFTDDEPVKLNEAIIDMEHFSL